MKYLLRTVFLVLITTMALANSAEKPLTVGFLTGTGNLGDQGFIDMAYAGLIKAQQKYGIRLVLE